MYVAERERRHLREKVADIDEWIFGLNITIQVEKLNAGNLGRAAQLLNKTNQMNLSTRRLSPQGLMFWADEPDHCLYLFRVRDRFGDYGLVGIGSLAVELERKSAAIVDFVLSCRVMGRQVEESMLEVLEQAARTRGCTHLVAQYLETAKNGPCLSFLERNLKQTPNENTFVSQLENVKPTPHCTTIVWDHMADQDPSCQRSEGTAD
jgi:FkbH-like protein